MEDIKEANLATLTQQYIAGEEIEIERIFVTVPVIKSTSNKEYNRRTGNIAVQSFFGQIGSKTDVDDALYVMLKQRN